MEGLAIVATRLARESCRWADADYRRLPPITVFRMTDLPVDYGFLVGDYGGDVWYGIT